MTATERLAEFAACLRFEDLPERTVEHAKAHVLDTLGVCIGGSRTTHAKQATALVRALGGAPDCTVIGDVTRTSMPEAAFANAVRGHAIDFDDGHKFIHPGCAVVPAALAAAEARHVSGADFLAAVVAGYEVSVRVSLAAGPPHRAKGFHPTATCNGFGAAAAVGRVLVLAPEAAATAFGIAASQSGGTSQYRFNGSPIKHLHAGLAARAGTLSALLAETGFGGAPEPIEGEFGFLNLYADGGEVDKLLADLGKSHKIAETDIKPYPSCRQTHTPVDLALEAVSNRSVDPRRISEIVLDTYDYTASKPWLVSNAPPANTLSAMLSVPYCIAVALLHGRPQLHHFESRSLVDMAKLELARRIEIREDPALTAAWPEERGARLTIRSEDGVETVLTATNPRGGVESPLSFDEIAAKFTGLAEPVIGDRAVQIIDMISRLEQVTDASDLAILMACRPQSGIIAAE